MRNKKFVFDSIVLDIEFLLISIVQGAALVSVADAASRIFAGFQMEYWFYITSAFLFILIFWSQAILHAISFIDWPPSLPHSFLYFLVSFIEITAFHQLDNPMFWYISLFFFFIATGALYFMDLSLIRKREKEFSKPLAKKKLYKHIYARQLFELRSLIPAGILFNLGVVILIFAFPRSMIENHYHVLFASLQTFFGIILLTNTLKSFKERIRRINDAI